MNIHVQHQFQGLLKEYSDALKGWQYRWFKLSPETGELQCFLSDLERDQPPRYSIVLVGAVITLSNEDSMTFTVNSPFGSIIKLKVIDGRARREWVNKLLAITKIYPRAHSPNSTKNPVAQSDVLDACANRQQQLKRDCRGLKRKNEKENLKRNLVVPVEKEQKLLSSATNSLKNPLAPLLDPNKNIMNSLTLVIDVPNEESVKDILYELLKLFCGKMIWQNSPHYYGQYRETLSPSGE